MNGGWLLGGSNYAVGMPIRRNLKVAALRAQHPEWSEEDVIIRKLQFYRGGGSTKHSRAEPGV